MPARRWPPIARAPGSKAYVFCPDDTPAVNVREIAMQGAEVFLVDGLIDDCGRLVAEGEKAVGWFNCSTLREPYRIEGKKTMGLELAEQLGWEVPDVIFYPTGGGTGIIGMWKAFAEMERWAGSARSGRAWWRCRRRAARRWSRPGRRAWSMPRAGRMRILLPPASACRRRSVIF